jgi:hypothetical protein
MSGVHPTVRAKDRAERAGRAWIATLVSAGLSQWVSYEFIIPWWGKALLIATGTAGGSFLFSFFAKFFGERGTASFVKGVEYS